MSLTVHEVLSLPLRRALLEALRGGELTVGALAERLQVSQATVSKQLRILREAGFVQVTVDAQRRWYSLRPEPFAEVAAWLEPYRWLWEDRMGRLGAQLDRLAAEERTPARTALDEETR